MQQPSINKQIFAIQLLSHLSLQYALPKSLNLCVTALNLLYALLGGKISAVHSRQNLPTKIIAAISPKQRVKLFKEILPSLIQMSEAFPPLAEEIVQLLVQLSRVLLSQASLASYFHDHLTWDSEIDENETREVSELAEGVFNAIITKTVLKTGIYN